MNSKQKTCYMITFHTPINYGAILQATALYKCLTNSFNLNTKIINFKTKKLKSAYPIIHFPKSIQGLKRFMLDILNIGNEIKKRKKFKKFVSQNLSLTKLFSCANSLSAENLESDFLVTGSDQVFRPSRSIEERSVFYLSFNNRSKYKFSYAGSFGGVQIEPCDVNLLKGYLSSFNRISVREKSGLETIQNIGLSASLVLDPVFLLSKDEWSCLAEKRLKIKKRFILYYALIDNSVYHHYVNCISKVLKLPVIVVGPIKNMPFKVYKNLKSCGPSEFISLVEQSSYVITSSFHGIAFSLIFKKHFFSLEEDPVLKDRAEDLLKKIGIKYLSFKEFLELCKNNNQDYINYNIASSKLSEQISESKSFIAGCIYDNK